MSEEERGFEVVDRRRVGQERAEADPSAAAPPPADERAPAGADAEEAGAPDMAAEGMPSQVTVGTVLRMSANLLHDAAWICMGLTPDPITGAVRRNLPEARRAIDALTDLTKYVEMDATPSEKRELEVMLSNLRLNFVQQSNRSE
jgi:hypothetical protein